MLGPVDFLAVEFPDGRMTGDGLRMPAELVARGTIAVRDLEFVVKAKDGTAARVALEDIPQIEPVDVSSWAGAFSGILDEA